MSDPTKTSEFHVYVKNGYFQWRYNFKETANNRKQVDKNAKK